LRQRLRNRTLDRLEEIFNVAAKVARGEIKHHRISEKIASKTLGTLLGVNDIFSNFRAYKRETISKFNLRGGETFGAEFLVIAKKKGLTIGEIKYDPPPRRTEPRIGGKTKANLRIIWALIKSLTLCLI